MYIVNIIKYKRKKKAKEKKNIDFVTVPNKQKRSFTRKRPECHKIIQINLSFN